MIYRVEIRKDGSIASCDVVESAFKDGGRVFYIDATTKVVAINEAKRIWSSLELRGKAAVARGLCRRCAKLPLCGKYFCRICADAVNASNRERRELKLRLSPEDYAVALSERATAAREKLRLRHTGLSAPLAERNEAARRMWEDPTRAVSKSHHAALRRALSAYDRDPTGFRAWLLTKLGMPAEEKAGPFDGWSQEDVERYAETGERPERTAAE